MYDLKKIKLSFSSFLFWKKKGAFHFIEKNFFEMIDASF